MYKEITPNEVEQLRLEKKLSIIDVREDEEVAQGKIPGAAHIPLGELEQRLTEIDKEQEHIMVCRSGARSGRASAFLTEKGYKVKNMSGGMLAWEGEIE
ncbi:rhodanese-like domain-containing protein [Ectobacillus antri]|jgi:rhodanese-related sulfurtransferase|uniref:Rhodanese-like domain-containing protein n=1 Tax=Ectobacillus antri TaxID=2486280 RepID=A0ABT6H158_9BACI|nr:rhodanese-like domain-containing protein [Ectobacillus antri]MDG4656017.1 rhodanese-like domain-containing protein [Ectobacillus antri]MDG5752692.1 rhodanese-like domain-containing protein [Ectobacillus antri]